MDAEFWICMVGATVCFDKDTPTTFSRLMGWLFMINAIQTTIRKFL